MWFRYFGISSRKVAALVGRRPVLQSSTGKHHSFCPSTPLQRHLPCCSRAAVTTVRGTTDLTWKLTRLFSSIFDVCCPVQLLRKSMSSSSSSSRRDPQMSQRMVWVDLEMTGLDIEKDQIIEMACIITDSELNILAEGPNLIVKQPDELLDGMSNWCQVHHGESGLTQAVRDSKVTLQQAEYEFLSFIRQHTPPGQCPLAGNSVHADKKFLDKFMPQFMYHLHYRIVDVSTIKELCRRWYPDEYKLAPQKKASHRALGDITESIKELQFYRAHVFKTGEKKAHKTAALIANGGGSNASV